MSRLNKYYGYLFLFCFLLFTTTNVALSNNETSPKVLKVEKTKVTSFKINNEDTSTSSRTVTLKNTCSGRPTQYQASESAKFINAKWKKYSKKPKFKLSPTKGLKKIYFRVRNATYTSKKSKATILYTSNSSATPSPTPLVTAVPSATPDPIIADHLSISLAGIPRSAIENAKKSLIIAYQHTSHGSQLVTGMTGLMSFAGAPYPDYKTLYAWNGAGSNNALKLIDYPLEGDLGSNGDLTWVAQTKSYLKKHPEVNVMMWSWCGGVSDNTSKGIDAYLEAMTELEEEFPKVKFVYMTGHTDIWSDYVLKKNNNRIRDYCKKNNKILYDFADIERYNPNGQYFEFVSDNCDYYSDDPNNGGELVGNWATEWQKKHQKGVEWYDCEAAHSEPLNANQKAYAAWWMFARIAGWDGNQ